jgi:dihydrofolate reductase
MKRIRYSVAMSLDGFIAGPNGEFDWIIMDPDFDFREVFDQFDTILIGRRSFLPASTTGPDPPDQNMFAGMKTYVVSTTLQQRDYPDVTIIGDDFAQRVAALREEPGKDIWLFGGGSLFRSLAEAGLVDTVEVGVMPILLGDGVPLLPPPAPRITLTLTKHSVYPKSGTIGLEYAVSKGPRS